MKTCEDCGCKVYGGYCVNCNEEHYIEEQYIELDMVVPKSIYEKSRKDDKEAIKRLEKEDIENEKI